MKSRWILILSVLILVSLACQLPGVSSEPEATEGPDLTMTAMFAEVMITPHTPTWTPIMPTDTLAPSATLPPMITDTPLPPTLTATHTLVPPTYTATRPAPSNTPAPSVRTVASITATYLGVAPDINGRLGEWNLTEYAVTVVVYGDNLWDNADDLSARVMAGWDSQNLYLGVEVIDEDYEQNTGGSNLFKGDSLEVLLDTNLTTDFGNSTLSADDFQLGISPGSPLPGEDPEAYLWYPASIAGVRDQVEIGAVRTDDGYNVEVAIPWSVFEMTPQAGTHYGFAFSISDNDIDGGVAQQSMISNVWTRQLTNPTTWGDLLLYRP